MYGVADNFGGQIAKEGLKIRFEALKDLEIEQISQAATYLMNNREKDYPPVPTVKEFRDATEAIKGPTLSIQSKVEIEIDKIQEHLRRYGASKPFVTDDEISMHLMTQRWNYQQWAKTVLTAELQWWRKEFRQSYEAYSESDKVQYLDAPESIKKLTEGIG